VNIPARQLSVSPVEPLGGAARRTDRNKPAKRSRKERTQKRSKGKTKRKRN
jgi:hypothetical protein